jgi:hydrogenase maturation protein HypF
MTKIRRHIQVQGIVQGVGFRPFVYSLAVRLGLGGFVRNDAAGVTIEVEGLPAAIDGFLVALRSEAPPLARIEALAIDELPPHNETAFAIVASAGGARTTLIAPDTAPCADCLREMADPADRRYDYPFLNCTNCGPRFTIVDDIPYDRANTTMAVFPMCAECAAEYADPLNRRFHAQPTACPACGPQLEYRSADPADPADPAAGGPDRFSGRAAPTQSPGASAPGRAAASAPGRAAASAPGRAAASAPGRAAASAPGRAAASAPGLTALALPTAAAAIRAGQIVAVKGLGGYHLACDARNAAAVSRLRARKHREAKPFALLVANQAIAESICYVNESEAALLASPQRPIVLLDRRPEVQLPPDLAPGYTTLGIMLPPTPLHVLLLAACAAPAGPPPILVLTSGNLSDEPIAYTDADALARLAPIADGFLLHNRAIRTRCDDSVTRIVAGAEQPLRRSRGYAPAPITLDRPFPQPILAYGGHLKNTFCLARDSSAFVSHHIGDLENLETLTAFREGIAHYQRLFSVRPAVVVHDLHPEYLATKEALAATGVQHIGVQHHHAHIASVIAEHGLDGPVLGIAADGTGYGRDGAIWGGELLLATRADFTRLGHLAYIPLIGGDQAIRHPWRVAAAYLAAFYGPNFADTLELPFTRTLDRPAWRTLAQMAAKGINSPPTSSLGRLFDAVAALIGLRHTVQYEGQAAVELEAIAQPGAPPYPMAMGSSDPVRFDLSPTFAAIIADLQAGAPLPLIAGRFHAAIAAMLYEACVSARKATGSNTVALSGGVFQNRLLLTTLLGHLERAGFRAYTNRRVPPNDGGLSLGQAVVAAARIA